MAGCQRDNVSRRLVMKGIGNDEKRIGRVCSGKRGKTCVDLAAGASLEDKKLYPELRAAFCTSLQLLSSIGTCRVSTVR